MFPDNEPGIQPGEENPYMYLSHYSTPQIVLYYLSRKYPCVLSRVENGVGGPSDNLFIDIGLTWHNT